jgi:hypothetical protein
MADLRDLLAVNGVAQLSWRQPKALEQRYVLVAEGRDTPLAELWWQSNRRAAAAAAYGTWTFQRSGNWLPTITVCRTDDGVAFANATQDWRGRRTLQMAAGAIFSWQSTNFWRTEWSWRDAAGVDLIRFASLQGFLRKNVPLTIGSRAVEYAELELLISLGLFMLILAARDGAATSAALNVAAGAAPV